MYSLGDRATVPVPAPLPPAGVQSPLSSWTPLLLVVGYIAPFYMRPYASRNALSTVYFRATVTVMWCSVAWIPLFLHLAYHQRQWGEAALPSLLQLLGLRSQGLITATLIPLVLTACLFAGPLCLSAGEAAAAGSEWADHIKQSLFKQWDPLAWAPLCSFPFYLQVVRNLLVAPLTEEFVFRAILAPLLLFQGWGMGSALWLGPLLFGLAHLHHCLHGVVFQGARPKAAVLQALVQMGYTTVFGWYAMYLYLRTGHLAAPVAAHIFCNWMGFPDFGRMLGDARARVALPTGMILFGAGIQPLTQPALYCSKAVRSDHLAPALQTALDLGHITFPPIGS